MREAVAELRGERGRRWQSAWSDMNGDAIPSDDDVSDRCDLCEHSL